MPYQVILTYREPHDIGDLIAHVLNHHVNVGVSIQLDEMDCTNFSAENRDWLADQVRQLDEKPAHMVKADERAKRQRIKAKIARQRREADEFRAQRDADNAVREEHFARSSEKAWRAEARRMDEAKAQKTIGCPQCFVGPGEPCSDNGQPRKPHPYRVLAVIKGMSVIEMQAWLDKREAEYAAVAKATRTTNCRACGAERDVPCITAGGHKMNHYAHKVRRLDAGVA